MGCLFSVQVAVKTEDGLAGLVRDGEQQFVLFSALGGERKDGSSGISVVLTWPIIRMLKPPGADKCLK